MDNISSFFEKFKKYISETVLVKESILEIIERNSSIKLSKENIKIRNKAIYITCSPIKRSEIVMNKEAILSSIAKEIPSLIILDIK